MFNFLLSICDFMGDGGGPVLSDPIIGQEEVELSNVLSIEQIENYLLCIEKPGTPQSVFETLITLKNLHRGNKVRMLDTEKEFVDFYGGPNSPLKFFYYPRQSGGSHTTWDDCYVGMSLPRRLYSRLKKAVKELGKEWTDDIYDISDVRLKLDDKTRTVFINVVGYIKYLDRSIT